MYTWGYIKDNTLSKLNMDEKEANDLGFLSRFPYYANEAMTQICSAIKAKENFFTVTVYDKNRQWKNITEKHGLYIGTKYYSIKFDITDKKQEKYQLKLAFWKEWESYNFVNDKITFPEDFIAFSDDIVEYEDLFMHDRVIDAGDEFLMYHGYNEVICKHAGIYQIPYKARWFFFTKDLEADIKLNVPMDILDAIPSYIASQCMKIDDEVRSAILKNEYEMALARIDDTTFKSQRGFHVGGGW